jgi:CxxC motif-containing protein (DUF1111 family)
MLMQFQVDASTRTLLVAITLCLTLNACDRQSAAVAPLLDVGSGGMTTVHDATRHAYSKPAANLETQQRADFAIGNAFFNSPWVVAPASAGARDGLGPLFNARSCDACHNNDGRGRPPANAQERPIGLVVQFGIPGKGPHGDPLPEPRYGGNLNPFGVGSIPAEGTIEIAAVEQPGRFADGEPYSLLAPTYTFKDLQYGELSPDVRFSPRVAPSVFGSGLLEAIAEAEILRREDPDDKDRDGISGRANRVWNRTVSKAALGRFGWKANQPDIAHQTAAAFNGEIGMSSQLLLAQNCMPGQAACLAAPSGGEPEISQDIFESIVTYERMLGVPARRDVEQPPVRRGAQLFLDAGCAACHTPTFKTPRTPGTPWLSEQIIHPYTDLLLHDMGPALADQREDFLASGSEWRTPPLWGLGLLRTVNGHTLLLHDGRARNASEAILWHGGEGERAKERFRTMSKDDRAALLAFLNSL